MERMNLTYKSSIGSFDSVNSSFDSGVLRVCYTGDNRNGSSISKEVFEKCIHTIYNCPIVCNYDRETDSIGEHDMSIVMKDGSPSLINETDPIGVVPAGANWWFEYDEGREYLCVDVLLWKRQEAYEHIKENGITDESMEISVTAYHKEDGIMVIDEFEFNAFCLLESAEPCYEGAGLILFSIDKFRTAFDEMIEDLKNVSASYSKVDIDIPDSRKEEQNLEKEKILAEFGLTAEQLGIEDLESCTEEDLKAKCEEYSLTAGQLAEQIRDALRTETYTDEWGTWSRYIYIDHDVESNTVYAVDTESDYNLYGLTYAMNGDNVEIDFSTPVRKKISYVDFDEGETQSLFAAVADRVAERSAAEIAAAKEEFAQKEADAAEKMSELNAELDELKQFKVSTLAAQRVEEVEAVFEQFTDLEGVEAFEELRSDYGDMSVEEIEDKCFSIRGRNVQVKFAKKEKPSARIPAKQPKQEDEPYGGIFEKYPPHK